jgi:hypothetical protein
MPTTEKRWMGIPERALSKSVRAILKSKNPETEAHAPALNTSQNLSTSLNDRVSSSL